MRRRSKARPLAEINVVPYIDVMLVLLVIFMITAPLLTQGVDIDLPEAAAKSISADDQEPIIVTVDAAGKYYLNKAKDPLAALAPDDIATEISSLLHEAKQKGIKPQVLVKGDKDVMYGKVVQAMVLLQQAGVAQVGLMTQPPEQGSA